MIVKVQLAFKILPRNSFELHSIFNDDSINLDLYYKFPLIYI
jgi:hypothetical protein